MPTLAPEQVYPTDLTDAQWTRVAPLLAKPHSPGRSQRVPPRPILYLLRTGCQWRMLPKDFPNWNTVRTTPTATPEPIARPRRRRLGAA